MEDSLELRQEMISVCQWLKSAGYVFGTWGNISVKLDEGNLLITPSRVDYDKMLPEDMVVITANGEVVSGTRLPTSERDLHRMIMSSRSDVSAIIHTHSTYAMAASTLNMGIPALSEEMCQLLGGGIPLSERFVPSEKHVELGEVVSSSIGNSNAVLIRNHGAVCCGASLNEAMICCSVVEKSAKIYLALLASGKFNEVPEQWVSAGREYYLHAYGRS